METGAFDQNVFGLVIDFAVLSTHHASQSDAFMLVGDEQHLVCECVFDPVEPGEPLSRARAANDDSRNSVAADLRRRIAVVLLLRWWATSDEVIIERMEWLTHFEHHIIRDIDNIVDAADTDFLQHRTQPAGTGTNFDIFDYTRLISRAKVRVFDSHSDQVLNVERGTRNAERGDLERIARHRADFPRDADDAIEVGPVERHFDVIDHVAGRPAKVLGERLADLRVFGQNQQAFHRTRQAKFLRRTHHALADDAEDSAYFDDERFLLARLQRQCVVRQDERHFVAYFEVLCSANDEIGRAHV